ncbi:hypothetical protein KL910_002899 [Ogataea haglerorum]|nr:hypothetical protein KL910_002899 [Ogataea haglerorum]KAG7790344.1 hypothetical protein KL945_001225 [Ogataea haglerorum]
MESLVDSQRPGEKRGRQYQVPKRYEFQKSIPTSRDSSAHTSIFKPNFTLNKLRREHSTQSLQTSLKRAQSPFFGSKNDHVAELKRHSLSAASGGGPGYRNHIINAYNDSKVFETVAPRRTSSVNYILDTRSNQDAQSMPPAPEETGKKSILINRPSPNEAPSFNSSISKINYYQSDFQGPQYIEQLKGRDLREASSRETKHGPSSTDNTTKSEQKGDTTDDETHSESQSSVQDNNDTVNPYLDPLESQAIGMTEFSTPTQTAPMRTQQRQLAIKDLMQHHSLAGSAWFELGPKDARKIEESTESSELINQNVWANVSIDERNKYEHISNDLRKLALYNKKPMMDCIGRYFELHKQTHISTKGRSRALPPPKDVSYLDSSGHFQRGVGRELAEELWNSAKSNFKFFDT